MEIINRIFDLRKQPRQHFELMKNTLTFDATTDSVENVLSLMAITSILEEYAYFAKLYRYALKFKIIQENPVYKYIYTISLGSYAKTTMDFQSAIEYFANSNKIAVEIGDMKLVTVSDMFICSVYHRIRDYEMASYYALRMVNSLKLFVDDTTYANVYNTYGVILTAKKDYTNALHFYKLSKTYFEKLQKHKEQANYAILLLNIFSVSLKLDMTVQAKEYLLLGNEIIKRNDYYYLLPELTVTISKYYRDLGDYENAYLYLSKYYDKNYRMLLPKFSLEREHNKEGIKQELNEIALLKEKNNMLLSRLKVMYKETAVENSDHHQLIDELTSGLNRNEIIAHFQPKWSVDKNKFIGAEALIRWQRSTEMVPPGIFIEKVENSEIICKLSETVIREAIRVTKKIVSSGHDDFVISVNITPYQLRNQDLARLIEQLLLFYQLDGRHFEIEITERSFIDEDPRIIDELYKIKSLGVYIALDDFGTGYSSLACMNTLPFDVIKIDRSLVSDVGNEKSAKLLEGLFTMIHSMDFKSIAEGVETEEQLNWLTNVGCKHIQGYYFSKPLAENDILKLLKIIQ